MTGSCPGETLYHSLQAKSWLGWEFAASSGRAEHLQWWNGSAWQQSSFPASSSDQPAPTPAANAGQRHQNGAQASASATDGSTSSSASQPSSNNSDKYAAANTATPAAMSSFTSQALLECHYSKQHAFLQDAPLLQVCFGLPTMLTCAHLCPGDPVDIYNRHCINHLSRVCSDSVCLHSVCQCSLSIVHLDQQRLPPQGQRDSAGLQAFGVVRHTSLPSFLSPTSYMLTKRVCAYRGCMLYGTFPALLCKGALTLCAPSRQPLTCIKPGQKWSCG